MLEYLALPPIQRGFLALLTAGIAFPLIGVFVIRLNLITLRFMLMHGALLGSALAMGLQISPLLGSLVVNLLLIFILIAVTRRGDIPTGYATTFLMVVSIALAVIVIYKAGVPAKDALSILWGNIYAVRGTELAINSGGGAAIILFILILRRRLTAVLFNYEVAATSGIPAETYRRIILIGTGITIAISMRLVGALLLDSLVLLPAVSSLLVAGSTGAMFLVSSLVGLFSALAGFILSLWFDIPVSAGVTLTSALVFGIMILIKHFRSSL